MTEHINLKKIDQNTAKLLALFFAESPNTNWAKDKTYTLKNGIELTFSNDLYKRKRKERTQGDRSSYKEGVRYEVISNKQAIGRGAYGSVFKIKGTLALDEHSFRFKKFGEDGKGRVVKVQCHNDKYPLTKLDIEYKLTHRAGHMAIKPPTIAANERFPISFTTMNELTGIKLSTIIEEDYLQINVLTSKQRADICKALLKALKEQVSSTGIIHRDIKPENIFVDLNDPINATIFDYGLSTEAATPDGERRGTPIYMAPEIDSNPEGINTKLDVYCMARVMALLWRVDRSESYNKNNNIKSFTIWKMCNSVWLPEKKLEGLFQGLNDLHPDKADAIRKTLLAMLQTSPLGRISIDEAINLFPSIENNESDLTTGCEKQDDHNQEIVCSTLNSYSLFNSNKSIEPEINRSNTENFALVK
ncbi:MAG: protein kinase [Tatlockia sp.]|nr:protein kinase [Tatlockia sp.]